VFDLGFLQSLQSFTYEENVQDSTTLMELYKFMYQHPKVIVAQIEGHAIAGGCGLATVCDFSFSVPSANLGYTEVKIGFIPAIVMVFLLRKIGEGKSKELLLTGKLIDAATAKDFGLINAVYEADVIENKVNAFVEKLCKQTSGAALRLTKEMIANVQEKTLSEGIQYAANMNATARGTADCQKGIAAFLNKEELSW
jgi:methylglutaconyl-CoA hydratase